MTVAYDGGAGAQPGGYIETGDVPLHTTPAHTRAWPQFSESMPVQLAASHLPVVRAEATGTCTVSYRGCRGIARSGQPNLQDLPVKKIISN